MLDVILQGVFASILSADTASALALLREHQANLLDPVEGVGLYSQILYCAIKHTNLEVMKYLLNLPVISDIPFYQFCGHTPLSLAVEEGHTALIPMLLAKTDKNFALHMAVKLNLIKTKTLLLSKYVFKEKLMRYLDLR